MDARLQRRIQRYGWDLAADLYEASWQLPLSAVQAALLEQVCLAPGEAVVDIACGTGLVTLAAAAAVGPQGRVLGTDISGVMVEKARRAAADAGHGHVGFERADGESLDLPEGSFDVALCALGLMYFPDPESAVRRMAHLLRRGGRIGLAVWGSRRACGWASVFPIVDAKVQSEVCPLFFRLGEGDALLGACREAGFVGLQSARIPTTLDYDDADEACAAAFEAGPVALAWSRFDGDTRQEVRRAYLESLERWRRGSSYSVPGEFVVVTGSRPGA